MKGGKKTPTPSEKTKLSHVETTRDNSSIQIGLGCDGTLGDTLLSHLPY